MLGKNLCEIEAAAKWYTKNARFHVILKSKKLEYLKNNELLVVLSYKSVGFCVIKKHTIEGKLTQLLESEQFERHDNMNDSFVQKNEGKNRTKNYWP